MIPVIRYLNIESQLIRALCVTSQCFWNRYRSWKRRRETWQSRTQCTWSRLPSLRRKYKTCTIWLFEKQQACPCSWYVLCFFLMQTAQFTRVTAESFKKGLEETRKWFKWVSLSMCSVLKFTWHVLKTVRKSNLKIRTIILLQSQVVQKKKKNHTKVRARSHNTDNYDYTAAWI